MKQEWLDPMLSKPPAPRNGAFYMVLLVPVALGAAAFAGLLMTGQETRAWGGVCVNLLLWGGLSAGGVAFAAILQVTGAIWARPAKRTGEAMGAFMPVAMLMLLLLPLGGEHLFSFSDAPGHGADWWFDREFLYLREIIGQGALYLVSWIFIYFSLRPDMGICRERCEHTTSVMTWMTAGWRGQEEEVERAERRNNLLAPILLLVYAGVATLMAVDLVMTLSPRWVSTLFGGYYFMGNLYGAVAVVIIAVFVIRQWFGFQSYLTVFQFYDLGKLLLAFCMIWAYLLWSQYLPIWYGNLPHETGFIVLRQYGEAWSGVSVLVVTLLFLLPFIALLSKPLKKHPVKMLLLAALILLGMIVERYLLILPSLFPEWGGRLALSEFFMTAGFFALFVLSMAEFFHHFPAMPVSDRRFIKIEKDLLNYGERYPDHFKPGGTTS